jgi:hypothetical protein
MKTSKSIFAIIFALLTAQIASAYYCPSTGKWLNRDPLGEPGSANLRAATVAPRVGQVVSQVSVPPSRWIDRSEGKNVYVFTGNDGINHWDNLGLFVTVNNPIIHPISRLKRCGTAVSRAIEQADDPTWWEYFHETISGILYPHQFVILDDGTRLTHGGTADGESHRTAIENGIYIDPCKSCSEFSKCMKENWPDDSQYTWYSHNCGYAVHSVVSKCGGIISMSPFWPD